MCIDFTDLNKACPKDDFPLPRIDRVVDDAANSQLMYLLDCFSGYHQIWMRKEDEEKTSFITPFDTYYFMRMPEGLKNAGQSFSRMSSVVLEHQLRRNVLAYIDDIVVTSSIRSNHVADLVETFASLRKAGLFLNPNKCIFGVHREKVLGCLVSTKGIEANPDKIKALWNMKEPRSIRDVQKLTGRIAALNRFIPRSADRSLPFFKVLRNANKFEWGLEQNEALQALKNHLKNMVKMTSPDPKDVLLLYIATSYSAVSAALVLERELKGKKKQLPVYFVSEALVGSKLLYSELEKIAYAVVMSAQKLRHYFEAHKIIVVTDQPLHDLFSNREASVRIAKWASELSEFYIDFERRTAIKSQVLADFIADWTSPTFKEELSTETWIVHCDGVWCNDGAGIAAIIVSFENKNKIRSTSKLRQPRINNQQHHRV